MSDNDTNVPLPDLEKTGSMQPFPDCCTLFQPRHPDTHVRPERAAQVEAALDIDSLVNECVAGVEVTDYGPLYTPMSWG